MNDFAEKTEAEIRKVMGIDCYLNWLEREGLPVYEGFAVDLFAVPTKPWPRYDCRGAAVHTAGRGDFVNMFLFEIAPGGATSPQRHLYEEVFYVLSGHGVMEVETGPGVKHSFEWGPRSLFAVPLNKRYRLFNGDGKHSARLVSTTNLPIMFNLFHKEKFIFENQDDFDERLGESRYFSGEGTFIPVRPGNHMWETNFIPDVTGIELREVPGRGAGGKNLMLILADGTMHSHIADMPVGTYKKAHRHAADFHVMCVNGSGYSLLWFEGDKEFKRVDWKEGTVFAPPDQMFHQHFNSCAEPVRYIATALGSLRYPFTESKRKTWFGGYQTSVKDGGDQIEYADQDPRIHQMYVEDARRGGFEVHMSEFIKTV
ncbi:MAG: cupin domain-containing protein [Burkholderiales bacterium]